MVAKSPLSSQKILDLEVNTPVRYRGLYSDIRAFSIMANIRSFCYYFNTMKTPAFTLFLSILSLMITSVASHAGILSDAQLLVATRPGMHVAVVNGTSMLPILRDGDVIVVKTIKKEALKRGMVCVYKNESGEIIAHSVVSVNPLRLKGANNKVIDPCQVIEVVGIMYATFCNWNREDFSGEKLQVLAKKY